MTTQEIKNQLDAMPVDQARELLYKFVVVGMFFGETTNFKELVEDTMQSALEAEAYVNDLTQG